MLPLLLEQRRSAILVGALLGHLTVTQQRLSSTTQHDSYQRELLPPKDKTAYNEYQRNYQLARYHKKRREALSALDHKCFNCGSLTDLQFDHINPPSKEHALWKDAWSRKNNIFNNELAKCQLLCKSCHKEKTRKERSHPVTFRGVNFPSKSAAIKYFSISWNRFYKEYEPL